MKKCGLCHKGINTRKERYVHVEDWERENLVKDIWCHLVCFNQGMNRELTDMEKQAKEALEKIKPVLNEIMNSRNAGENNREVYEIRDDL